MSDSRTFSRVIAAGGLIAGPALLLSSVLIAPAFTVGPEGASPYLARVAEAPDTHLLAAVLFLLGGIALVPGLMGVMRLLRGDRVGLGPVAAALVLLGVLTVPAFYFLNVVQLEMVSEGLDRGQMEALFARLEEGTGGTVLLAMFGGGTVIGVVLLAIALLRRRAVPVWGPIALMLSVLVGLLPDDRLYSALEFALLLVGTSAIALRLLRLSDAQWERWAPLASR